MTTITTNEARENAAIFAELKALAKDRTPQIAARRAQLESEGHDTSDLSGGEMGFIALYAAYEEKPLLEVAEHFRQMRAGLARFAPDEN